MGTLLVHHFFHSICWAFSWICCFAKLNLEPDWFQKKIKKNLTVQHICSHKWQPVIAWACCCWSICFCLANIAHIRWCLKWGVMMVAQISKWNPVWSIFLPWFHMPNQDRLRYELLFLKCSQHIIYSTYCPESQDTLEWSLILDKTGYLTPTMKLRKTEKKESHSCCLFALSQSTSSIKVLKKTHVKLLSKICHAHLLESSR